MQIFVIFVVLSLKLRISLLDIIFIFVREIFVSTLEWGPGLPQSGISAPGMG
jgi:hypothetical protein